MRERRALKMTRTPHFYALRQIGHGLKSRVNKLAHFDHLLGAQQE
jgi:hypothetical protein